MGGPGGGGGGSVRVIEDILLRERDGVGKSKNDRASCGKRSECGQGREMAYKKVHVQEELVEKYLVEQ